MAIRGSSVKDIQNPYEQAEHDDSDIQGKKVKLIARESITDKRLTATTNSSKVSLDVNITGDTSGSEGVADNPEYFEDTSFVTGDSPATLDINAALGRNATQGYIINDGAGNFTVAFSTNGTDFGDAITMKSGEVIKFDNISVDSVRITWVADSAYRASFI